ncbi:hypothetical protein K435DRAFT_247387 [Dendrothele bispora CBS 962.96]|uniref:F-box domain-containing protein n=1 Tax=Dendrothele bispora (strain CBS 962.96) TaxID=1314807 RepID=A0A4S8LNF2_DENBC|nr:hypothetical protein K435DRAFT_247387 [Dendrothele bispora CBS 962.96]
MSAFEASEIIERILQCSNKSTINHCARVNKQWSEIALDLLWREITNLGTLLSPLGVFGFCFETEIHLSGSTGRTKRPQVQTQTQTITHNLLSQPTNEEWMRFEKHYAPRVRVLRLGRVPNALIPALEVLYRIRRSSKPLLPNLHTVHFSGLSGKGLMEPLFLFVHENVLEFMLNVLASEPYQDATQTVLRVIPHRMPLLEKLDIIMGPDSRYVSSINELIRNLPSLNSLTIPVPGPVLGEEPEVHFSFLISLKNLKTLTLRIAPGFHQFDGKDFPTLETLTLFSDYSTASSILYCMMFPRVENLKLCTSGRESSHDLQVLLSSISQSCPTIVQLSLDLDSGFLAQQMIMESSLFGAPTDHLHYITSADLSPILSIATIISFEIKHPFCLNLGLDDAETIASAWPNLKFLNLNAAPMNVSPVPAIQQLDLHSLLPFARRCPDIEELGIFLNAEPRNLPSESDIDALPPHFTKLKTVFFGKSSISDEGEVAQFLSCVCPIGCNIGYGRKWYVCEGDNEFAKKWIVVGDLLPHLFVARKRYEKKLALERKHWMSMSTKDVCT